MIGKISATREVLNALTPDNCDCSEIKALANAYDGAVQTGDLAHEQAVAEFGRAIDLDCEGKVPRESLESEFSCFADGCGVAEKVCKHSKYLIAMMMKIRND